jgi:hypothetical protein
MKLCNNTYYQNSFTKDLIRQTVIWGNVSYCVCAHYVFLVTLFLDKSTLLFSLYTNNLTTKEVYICYTENIRKVFYVPKLYRDMEVNFWQWAFWCLHIINTINLPSTNFWQKRPSILQAGSWVGPQAILDVTMKRNNKLPAEWCSWVVSTTASYSGGPGFKSQSRDWLPWLISLLFSSVPPGKCWYGILNAYNLVNNWTLYWPSYRREMLPW